VAEDSEEFDLVESMVEYWAEHYGVDSDRIWEDLESVDDEELLSEAEAWQKSFGKNKNGGLNKKGVASYRRSHPGSKLQTAVTTKPSKLKKGSKAAKRRKSFCARMKGMKKHRTGAATKHDPNSRINKSLRKWNCENVEQLYDVYLALTEKYENSRGYVK
jgi:excinuclease UvrABC ATPase subunit